MTRLAEGWVPTGRLRLHILGAYPADHPLRRVGENLPDQLPPAEYLAVLRLLLPLTHEDQALGERP